jgi:hypothetical protein
MKALGLALILIAGGIAAGVGESAEQSGLEDGEPNPAHWSTLNLWGAEAQFAVDKTSAHSGSRGFRISAPIRLKRFSSASRCR